MNKAKQRKKINDWIINRQRELTEKARTTERGVGDMSLVPTHIMNIGEGETQELELTPTLQLLIELDKKKQLKPLLKDLNGRNSHLTVEEQAILKKIEEYQKTKGKKDEIRKLDLKWRKRSPKFLIAAGLGLKRVIKRNRKNLKINPKMAHLLGLSRDNRVILRNKVDVDKIMDRLVKMIMDNRHIEYLIKTGVLPQSSSPNSAMLRAVTSSIFRTIKRNPQFIGKAFSVTNNRKIKNVLMVNRNFLISHMSHNQRRLKKAVKNQLEDRNKILLEKEMERQQVIEREERKKQLDKLKNTPSSPDYKKSRPRISSPSPYGN